jgi:hypothetical protein
MNDKDTMAQAEWRKSSFSGDGGKGGGNCVEVAALPEQVVAVRDSKNPQAGVVFFSRPGFDGLLSACKAGGLGDSEQTSRVSTPGWVQVAEPGPVC